MTTTVVHVNNSEGFDVYCGRFMPGRFPQSKWANPHRVNEVGRGNAIRMFVETMPDSLREACGELRGLRLGCWCAKPSETLTGTYPVPYKCHCQVLAALADGYEPLEDNRLF